MFCIVSFFLLLFIDVGVSLLVVGGPRCTVGGHLTVYLFILFWWQCITHELLYLIYFFFFLLSIFVIQRILRIRCVWRVWCVAVVSYVLYKIEIIDRIGGAINRSIFFYYYLVVGLFDDDDGDRWSVITGIIRFTYLPHRILFNRYFERMD